MTSEYCYGAAKKNHYLQWSENFSTAMS